MPDINEFTFWKTSCVQNPKNCIYPTKVIVTDADSFNEMAHYDHVTAEYDNCYRSNDTFRASDVQSCDVDNDNVGNPDVWITKEDIHQMFIGVPHIISESKNHMKPPVPRYHVFWKADKETDSKAYAAFKERLHRHFPFLDPKALDAARYFDGTENPNAEFHKGSITINEYLDRLEAEEKAESDFDEEIPEGTRNSTMFRFAVRMKQKSPKNMELKALAGPGLVRKDNDPQKNNPAPASKPTPKSNPVRENRPIPKSKPAPENKPIPECKPPSEKRKAANAMYMRRCS